MRPFAASAALLAMLAGGLPAGAEQVSRDQDGLTVYGELELAEGKSLTDGLTLMLHGTMGHSGMEIMQAFQERLAERGHSSLAVTLSLGLNGREGFYDCAEPSTHRQVDALAELAGWIEWLKSQEAGPVALLGHSRGGNQVARYLAEAPDPLVTKAILVAPTGLPQGDEVEPLLELAAEQPDDAMLTAPKFLNCTDTHVSAGAIRGYYQDDGRYDTPALLTQIDIPVLMLAASDDSMVPDLPERMQAVTAEKVTFQVIEGDHFFRDFAADDAADAIDAFLAQ